MEKSSTTLTWTWNTQYIRYISEKFLYSDKFPNFDNQPNLI